ncbi:hypothetical protein OHC33_007506 [Knufia fluminis]|uniref:Enoyl reductase (ER) domain-containing protein n=1 Tax=Knufia fluminis TaxID=191047 RepID=A0AAN8EK90_9EURO|nr:hypothetical protein OHC33_007506 [Knufia fluminis]
MKVVRVVGYHKNLQLDEAPEPKITSPLDVIVKIGTAGVCRTDIHIIEGQWVSMSGVTLPYTIGHGNTGWVHAKGDGVTNVELGDKVILHPLVTCGLCRACHFGDDAARKLRPGDFCVLIGAGGLGHIGIQVLKAVSAATLIVIDRNPDALKLAKELGADHVIEGSDDGSFVQKVLDLTGGKGAEATVDFVAEGGSTKTGVKMIRRAGDYYVVGYGEDLQISTIDIISTEISFIGNLVGSYKDLAELMVLAAQGKVKLHTSIYKLEDFQTAIDDLGAGKVRARAILVP